MVANTIWWCQLTMFHPTHTPVAKLGASVAALPPFSLVWIPFPMWKCIRYANYPPIEELTVCIPGSERHHNACKRAIHSCQLDTNVSRTEIDRIHLLQVRFLDPIPLLQRGLSSFDTLLYHLPLPSHTRSGENLANCCLKFQCAVAQKNCALQKIAYASANASA